MSGHKNEELRVQDAIYRNARPKAKQYKLADGEGLVLVVHPNGSKYWRMRYRHQRKENTYAIGVYPDVTLAQAREARKQAREWLREGLDPTLERKNARARVAADQAMTFRKVAESFYKEHAKGWADKTRSAQRSRLDNEILPRIGDRPIREVTSQHVLAMLTPIHERGAEEVVAKCRILTSNIFTYAGSEIGLEFNPVDMLKGRLPRTKRPVHRRYVSVDEMPALFEAMRKVPAENTTKLAFAYTVITASRSDEVRHAPWREIVPKQRWQRLPPERMPKNHCEHIVPFSTQAIEILERAKELRTSKDGGAWVFPGFSADGALSANVILTMLARGGFYRVQTGHGFRGAFSTWAHEQMTEDETPRFSPAWIELCLAHVQGGIEGVYNDAKYIAGRRLLLQAWADQCFEWGLTLPD